ncbi:hypothetical protein COOONC_09572 [Cooperia oncophora]
MTSVTLHGVTDTLSGQDEKYASALETAAAAFREAEQLFNDPAFAQKIGWKVDEENDEGDTVYAKHTPKGKMVAITNDKHAYSSSKVVMELYRQFCSKANGVTLADVAARKLECENKEMCRIDSHLNLRNFQTELPLDVDSVMNETWTGLDALPKWNPNINFARTVAAPTPYFDIITYGNNDVLIVSGRDFVSARIYRNTPTGYIMASRSVRLKEVPEQKGKVR